MGKKDPNKGGVYVDCWHIPGGGVEAGQSFEAALKREVLEEVGIDITPYTPEKISFVDNGVSEKTLKDTGEKVLCHMEFNRFRVVINDKNADKIKLKLEDDLVEARWFDTSELSSIKQVPAGKELFQKLGYIN
jgi:8-oxo-dGTP pyrophosphatase MutT (NUDIX family)